MSHYLSRAFDRSRRSASDYDDECCGTCGSHLYDHNGLYTCRCSASPYFEEYTEYSDVRDEYHERGTPRPESSARQDFAD